MRHNRKNNHLGRKTAHRSAMLSNMASSLIMHKRIFTTVPKAKELRKYVEPLITKSKEDTTHSRREVFSKLQNKTAVTELFQSVSQKVGDRPGGYTRIIKTGFRLGDNAAMCFIELVDYNENMLSDAKPKKGRTRRSRRRSSGDAAPVAAVADTPKANETEAKATESVAENEVETGDAGKVDEAPKAETAPKAEAAAEEAPKAKAAKQPAAEKATEAKADEKAEEKPADDTTK